MRRATKGSVGVQGGKENMWDEMGVLGRRGDQREVRPRCDV